MRGNADLHSLLRERRGNGLPHGCGGTADQGLKIVRFGVERTFACPCVRLGNGLGHTLRKAKADQGCRVLTLRRGRRNLHGFHRCSR